MDLRAITDFEGGRLQTGKLFGPVGPPISQRTNLAHCQSVVGPLLSPTSLSPVARPEALYIRFSRSLHNVMLTNSFCPQMPAVKTNPGTPACPLPGA